jgi:hypothetical protein
VLESHGGKRYLQYKERGFVYASEVELKLVKRPTHNFKKGDHILWNWQTIVDAVGTIRDILPGRKVTFVPDWGMLPYNGTQGANLRANNEHRGYLYANSEDLRLTTTRKVGDVVWARIDMNWREGKIDKIHHHCFGVNRSDNMPYRVEGWWLREQDVQNLPKSTPFKVGEMIEYAVNLKHNEWTVGTITKTPTTCDREGDYYTIKDEGFAEHGAGEDGFMRLEKDIRPLTKVWDFNVLKKGEVELEFQLGDKVEYRRHDSDVGTYTWKPGTITSLDPGDNICLYQVNGSWKLPTEVRKPESKPTESWCPAPLVKTPTVETKDPPQPKEQPEEEPMTPKVLIVDPEKQGELVLIGTGHHFDKVAETPVCLNKGKVVLGSYLLEVVGYGMDFYTDGVWDEVLWYYLPDNLGERIMKMTKNDLAEIQKRTYTLLPPLQGRCWRCENKPQPGENYCGEHLREKQKENAAIEALRKAHAAERKVAKAKWVAGAPRRKRIRRRIYGGLLAVVLYFAACDFGTLTPRQWVKHAAYTVGNTLKSIERK